MTAQETFRAFERAANTQDFSEVAPYIADEAVYWFTDGKHIGIAAIRQAFEATWGHIADEQYVLSDVQWLVEDDNVAVVAYRFHSTGRMDGRPYSAWGLGTNVLRRRGGVWQIIHEHLSRDPGDGANG